MSEALPSSLERLFALVKRELRADEVELFAPGHPVSGAENVVAAVLPDGRHVAAVFLTAPEDREALARRLGVIVDTFATTMNDDDERRPSRPPPVSVSLHDELRALATRARAADAVVIDAHSPVVWGSATERSPWREVASTPDLEDALRELHQKRVELDHAMTGEVPALPEASPDAPQQDITAVNPTSVMPPRASEPPSPTEADLTRRRELTRRALAEVRALPGIEALRRGRPIRGATERPELGWVAHSFAGIYLAVLVFDGPYEELRAQRALHDGLPRIERLVLALPPFDPEPQPMGAVVSLRGRRR